MTNNDFTKKIIDDARNVRMSEQEKSAMRARIAAFMREGRARTHAPLVPSPFSFEAVLSYLSKRSVHMSAPLALVLLFSVGIGTSFAAESALPGDVLYPVKIHVNENVSTALARTPKESAKVEAKLATRRLEETEKLVEEKGELPSAVHEDLKKNFSAKVEALERNIKELEEKKDWESSKEVNREFESELEKHPKGLLILSAEAATGSPIRVRIENSSAIRSAIEQVSASRDKNDEDEESNATTTPKSDDDNGGSENGGNNSGKDESAGEEINGADNAGESGDEETAGRRDDGSGGAGIAEDGSNGGDEEGTAAGSGDNNGKDDGNSGKNGGGKNGDDGGGNGGRGGSGGTRD